MGRHPRDWDPERFENSRKRQRRRQIAPLLSEDLPAAEEDPLSTAQQPSGSSRINMAASVPNGTQQATSVPQTVPSSSANTNSGGLFTTVGRENDETLTEARVKIVPGSKKVGITEDYANRLKLFLIERSKNKRRSTTEGPGPTDILRTKYSAKVKIRHPSNSDPNGAAHMTAYVWTPDPPRQMDHDVRLPSNLRATLCESRDEEEQIPAQPVVVRGLTFMTVDGALSIPPLLESEHDDISNSGFCHRCWDEAMLESGIGPSYL